MCGIGGIINLENKEIDLREGARTISHTLRHRGPDDEGYLFFNPTGFTKAYDKDTPANCRGDLFPFLPDKPLAQSADGQKAVFVHRRLAIIDTGAGGHQPMCSHDEKLWVTYNGEIYNYIELRKELEASGFIFRTQSDTEVLLNAYKKWGKDCLKRLNGMFAFALWDQELDQIFCGRDRSGVKPFYYYFREGIFCFASELKALKALPFTQTSLNERAVQHYLLYDALEYEEEGLLKNIYELFPGHFITLNISERKFRIDRYYKAEINASFRSFDEKEFEVKREETQALVKDAILKRLRSDVPVGCCLSGGLDSSVIAGVIAGQQQDLHAFTASFPGTTIDESNYAKEVAEFTNSKWHTVTPSADELARDFNSMIYALDIPIWSTSTYAQYRVMQLARQNNIKVVLDGQGGDELFAGYPHYYITFVNELLRNKKFGDARRAANGFGKDFFIRFGKERIKQRFRYNKNENYLNQEFVDAFDAPKGYSSSFKTLNEHLHYDFFTGRLKTYLRCEDRCGMHHSVESRTPFADDNTLLTTLSSYPSVYKLHNGVSKYLLRESMKAFLPDSVYKRRDKMGFLTPHNRWLNTLLKDKRQITEHPAVKPYFSKRFRAYFNQLCAKNNQLSNDKSQKEETLAFKALAFSTWYDFYII